MRRVLGTGFLPRSTGEGDDTQLYDVLNTVPVVPFGGTKTSGLGVPPFGGTKTSGLGVPPFGGTETSGLGVPLWDGWFVVRLGREGTEGDDLAVEQHMLLVTKRAIGMVVT